MSARIQSESSATDPYVHAHPYYFFFPDKPADNKSSRAASTFAVVFFRTTGLFDAALDASSSSFCFNSAFFATLAARAAESLRFLLAGFPSCERFVQKDINCETTTRKNLDHGYSPHSVIAFAVNVSRLKATPYVQRRYSMRSCFVMATWNEIHGGRRDIFIIFLNKNTPFPTLRKRPRRIHDTNTSEIEIVKVSRCSMAVWTQHSIE